MDSIEGYPFVSRTGSSEICENNAKALGLWSYITGISPWRWINSSDVWFGCWEDGSHMYSFGVGPRLPDRHRSLAFWLVRQESEW